MAHLPVDQSRTNGCHRVKEGDKTLHLHVDAMRLPGTLSSCLHVNNPLLPIASMLSPGHKRGISRAQHGAAPATSKSPVLLPGTRPSCQQSAT